MFAPRLVTLLWRPAQPLTRRLGLSAAGRLSCGQHRFMSAGVASREIAGAGIQKHISALRFKSRAMKKRSIPGKDEWSVVGYSAAEAFDLFSLLEGLEQQLIYTPMRLSEDLEGNCVYVRNKYQTEGDQVKEIFFFKEGSVIFWNVPELERNSVLKFLAKHAEDAYEEDIVYDESEMMAYSNSSTDNSFLSSKGMINLGLQDESQLLAKYTFSNAIATSVKLGSWEVTLERLIDSIEHIAEDLKRSANVKLNRNEVLQKTGEMLALRHLINLSSDLLDTPDFYWDREQLENLYLATCSHLAVGKRTKIVNEKLNHCLELMELIGTHLNNEHEARLEWIIIILIGIEICFEVLHLVERKYGGFTILDPPPSDSI